MVAAFQSAIATSLPFYREERREETDPAADQLRPDVVARLTKQLAGHQSRDCPPQVAKVPGVLDQRLRVPVPLEDDAIRLVLVEVDLVLQGSGVLAPHDLHELGGQALELLELALAELEPTDALDLPDCPPVHDSALLFSC